MTITIDALAQAAENGTGIAHLTPAQAWAAHHLNLALEHLEHPLAYHIEILLASQDQHARKAFFESAEKDDAEAMIAAAYDDRHPMYLRQQILDVLQEGFEEFFPGLKPTGVDSEGKEVYSSTDLAKALDIPEEEILADIERRGWGDMLGTKAVHPIH
mgnify:CR=1 FL=1